ncbi:MAG: hypothetical protein JW981_06580 [Anaerolineae bacterium]|nr:hypothetical protein [Anaerolineae bacterium]
MTNLLKNPGFEGNWCRKTYTGQEFGEIFTPESWVAYWKEGGPVPHDPNNRTGYGRPEMHVINREPPFLDPLRVRSGNRSLKYFTFYRIHNAGVFQQVSEGFQVGDTLQASAWAHAWSNNKDDAHASAGAGAGAYFALEGSQSNSDIRNFIFQVGIDPTGGTDPWQDSIVWGKGAHIYNVFAQVPTVEVKAQNSTVTVFLRSRVLWPFKHCDTYWDDAELVVAASSSGPSPRPPIPITTPEPDGDVSFVPPRQQYTRHYLLLHPGTSGEWLKAIADSGVWSRYHWTVGTNADDAGMGPADRHVLVINPQNWPLDIKGFLESNYPGIEYRFVHANTPKELVKILATFVKTPGLW